MPKSWWNSAAPQFRLHLTSLPNLLTSHEQRRGSAAFLWPGRGRMLAVEGLKWDEKDIVMLHQSIPRCSWNTHYVLAFLSGRVFSCVTATVSLLDVLHGKYKNLPVPVPVPKFSEYATCTSCSHCTGIPWDEPASWTSHLPVVQETQTARGGKKGAWVKRKIKHFPLSTFKTVLNAL